MRNTDEIWTEHARTLCAATYDIDVMERLDMDRRFFFFCFIFFLSIFELGLDD